MHVIHLDIDLTEAWPATLLLTQARDTALQLSVTENGVPFSLQDRRIAASVTLPDGSEINAPGITLSGNLLSLSLTPFLQLPGDLTLRFCLGGREQVTLGAYVRRDSRGGK